MNQIELTGDALRAMALVAMTKTPMQHDAKLTVEYTNGTGFHFVMWTGAHSMGAGVHKLLASVTDQARLEAHWDGFIENVKADAFFKEAEVSTIKEGEFVRKIVNGVMGKKTYKRGEYDRATRQYQLDDYDDISRCVYVKKGTKLAIGFTY